MKLENVLFSDVNKRNIKVVDFGLSGYCHKNGEVTDAGTLKYMAPEVLSGKNVNATKDIDVWALGVILYALLFNGLPFLGDKKEDIVKNIIEKTLELPESYEFDDVKLISIEAEDLLRSMLHKDPEKRINLVDAKSHKWFSMSHKEIKSSVRLKYENYLTRLKRAKDLEEKQNHALLLMRIKQNENR